MSKRLFCRKIIPLLNNNNGYNCVVLLNNNFLRSQLWYNKLQKYEKHIQILNDKNITHPLGLLYEKNNLIIYHDVYELKDKLNNTQ